MLIFKTKQIRGGGRRNQDEATIAGGKLREVVSTPKILSGTQGASSSGQEGWQGPKWGVYQAPYCSAGLGFARKAGDGHKIAGEILRKKPFLMTGMMVVCVSAVPSSWMQGQGESLFSLASSFTQIEGKKKYHSDSCSC